ncbi:MAG TPA: hypothetical protein V6D22_13510 [Candidatus Obscuribacterales bacterium]
MNRKFAGIAVTSMIAALVISPATFADETQTAAATGSQTATEPVTTAPAAGASEAQAAAPSTGPADEVVAGPMLQQRRQLLEHIHTAGAHGIGITNYMMAFNAVEDQVRNGASETQIKPRVDQLSNALLDQLKRAQILKTQRPLPPTSSQQPETAAAAPAAPAPAAPAAGGGLNLGNLQDKLGGIQIPESLKEKFLNSDKAKEILKRLGQ